MTIVAFKSNDPNITIDPKTNRAGTIYISNPSGELVKGGYWMDYPEKGWKHNGVDLLKDFDRRFSTKGWKKAAWYQIPIQKRLEIEAKWQATMYAPLSVQFEEAKGLT